MTNTMKVAEAYILCLEVSKETNPDGDHHKVACIAVNDIMADDSIPELPNSLENKKALYAIMNQEGWV